jgi:hypothetical protein
LSMLARFYTTPDRDLVQRNDQAMRLARYLCQEFSVSSMMLVRSGGSKYKFSPEAPLAVLAWQMVLAPDTLVAETYEDVNAFWNAGWDHRENFRSGAMLSRGTTLIEDDSYVEKFLEMEWTLARAAKPGKTKYFNVEVEPELESIFSRGESVLKPVGYAEEALLAEYSCYLGEGEHIPGWEIYGLRTMINARALHDGRPLDVARIVFVTREMAIRERRPLLDIGAKVFYQDAPDKLVEITE